MGDTEQVMDVDAFLAHYGVKGMKWGHRKTYSSADIKAARARNAKREGDLLSKAYDVSNTKKGTAARAKADKAYNKAHTDYLKNPDRATALRMTKGEKIAVAVIAATGVGAPAAVGYTAGTVGVRKATEAGVRRANKKK